MSWSLNFDCAASFAMMFNGNIEGLRHRVVKAEVARGEVVFYTHERGEDEVILATMPIKYQVIDDVDQLAAAKARWMARIKARLKAEIAAEDASRERGTN